jgi:hypothetical protein
VGVGVGRVEVRICLKAPHHTLFLVSDMLREIELFSTTAGLNGVYAFKK